MSSTCVLLVAADNQAVGREDRAMLRSNPSARADARAWAAMLLSLLILPIHAWATNAVNLLEPYIRTLPTLETPWLPFGKISGARNRRDPIPGGCAATRLATGYPLVAPTGAMTQNYSVLSWNRLEDQLDIDLEQTRGRDSQRQRDPAHFRRKGLV